MRTPKPFLAQMSTTGCLRSKPSKVLSLPIKKAQAFLNYRDHLILGRSSSHGRKTGKTKSRGIEGSNSYHIQERGKERVLPRVDNLYLYLHDQTYICKGITFTTIPAPLPTSPMPAKRPAIASAFRRTGCERWGEGAGACELLRSIT
uniref:Uncharacterized protein n=1 Tax=Ananas comosus var. bracteatus TaxID=296719 RepID=A0A6V7QB29_ANACO|nr:unnamed protein product [Ananas comosus var. bracteatus]